MAKIGRPPMADVVNTCRNCSKQFVDPKRHRRVRLFCSLTCSAAQNKTGENRNCIECGKDGRPRCQARPDHGGLAPRRPSRPDQPQEGRQVIYAEALLWLCIAVWCGGAWLAFVEPFLYEGRQWRKLRRWAAP